ncbi:MAG: glycosyltransferase [Anaerolineae bacterium]|nr:glycosyltransferase [Anaerolineae bacterium]
MKKKMVVAWVRRDQRSELLAQTIGGSVHFVNRGQQGKLWQAPFRYPLQAWDTWRLLRRERPDILFVQNPPIFAAMLAYLYARLHGAEFGIDSHTAAFIAPRWNWALPLHRWLSRRALVTLVPNQAQGDIVEGWGVPSLVLGFTPGDYPAGEPYPMDGKFNVAVVSTYETDEPLDVVFQAAERLSDVGFYVTGDERKADAKLLAQKPDNCHLTGYLSYDEYVGLLRGADAVMDLTTRNHTLLMGGYEAVSFGVPLITSDWPVLRDYFALGTVHVPNTVEGVYEGVQRARRDQDVLREEMPRLNEKLVGEYTGKVARLRSLLKENGQISRPANERVRKLADGWSGDE